MTIENITVQDICKKLLLTDEELGDVARRVSAEWKGRVGAGVINGLRQLETAQAQLIKAYPDILAEGKRQITKPINDYLKQELLIRAEGQDLASWQILNRVKNKLVDIECELEKEGK